MSKRSTTTTLANPPKITKTNNIIQNKSNAEKSSHISFENIKKDDMLCSINYYKVLSKDTVNKTVRLQNDNGLVLDVTENIPITEMYSADYYHSEVVLPRSLVVQHLLNARDIIFTVSFRKKVNPKDIIKHIDDTDDIDELLNGETRILTGILNYIDKATGRTFVTDLKIPPNKNRMRQVDNRTISWLIIKNVKYIVSK